MYNNHGILELSLFYIVQSSLDFPRDRTSYKYYICKIFSINMDLIQNRGKEKEANKNAHVSISPQKIPGLNLLRIF